MSNEWPLSGWTEHPQRYWYRRCDMCTRRRLFQWLYECYPPVGSDFGWWFACCDCLYHSDAWLSEFGRELAWQWAQQKGKEQAPCLRPVGNEADARAAVLAAEIAHVQAVAEYNRVVEAAPRMVAVERCGEAYSAFCAALDAYVVAVLAAMPCYRVWMGALSEGSTCEFCPSCEARDGVKEQAP